MLLEEIHGESLSVRFVRKLNQNKPEHMEMLEYDQVLPRAPPLRDRLCGMNARRGPELLKNYWIPAFARMTPGVKFLIVIKTINFKGIFIYKVYKI